jgi:hypothetical protein
MKKYLMNIIINALETPLQKLFDKFRVSSPKIALLVFSGLIGLSKGVDVILSQPEAISLLGPYAEIISTVVSGLSMLLAALTGTAPLPAEEKPSLTKPVIRPKDIVLPNPEQGSISDILKNHSGAAFIHTTTGNAMANSYITGKMSNAAPTHFAAAAITTETGLVSTKKKHWKSKPKNADKKEN